MPRNVALSLAVLFAAFALVPGAEAGTQDFTLVNQTGTEIYRLYISETSNDDWEEDVLGESVLPHGQRMKVNFYGRSACYWDMMVADEEGNTVTWTGLNLCESSVVVLRCNDEECWAEYE